MPGKALTDGEYKDLLTCLIEGVPSRDVLDPEAVRSHLASKTASHEAVARLLAQSPLVLSGDNYPITVDYNLSLEQMIAAGHYDWVNADITSNHFPVGSGTATLEGRLVHYGKNMSSEAVLADLDQNGLRPATLAELLAFGAKYPELQRQFPIIELGSLWQSPGGGRDVACLDRDGRKRSLDLGWFGSDWHGSCRFLAFRK